ncbi:MAG: pirin family protein [Gammaproteobacteria bacterium]|jgi:redox-sensitive bicupin YhaK (pirin superfamily)|nr:pirin family protein [Gammaproteobacteria bacterium]
MNQRTIKEILTAQASRDGDGVAIQRIAGMQQAAMDPILMIDELRSEHREDFAGGFPPHPHRGMQTLTYMKRGGIIHEDNQGNRGEIRGGGAQWMSAGRGIIHSEMPTQDTTGLHGFQLWVNLPRAQKMSAPRYRDVPRQELTCLDGAGFHAIAIAGRWQMQPATGAAVAVTGPLVELAERAAVLDLALEADALVTVLAAPGETLLGYVYEGAICGRAPPGGAAPQAASRVAARHLLVTTAGASWTLQAGSGGANILLLRGEPLGEPVAQYGPFVMNTAAEIEQAIADYRSGNFGAAPAGS